MTRGRSRDRLSPIMRKASQYTNVAAMHDLLLRDVHFGSASQSRQSSQRLFSATKGHPYFVSRIRATNTSCDSIVRVNCPLIEPSSVRAHRSRTA